jgi:hypothetical protein
VNNMTYLKELPVCQARFGRTDISENGDKKIARMILACGYREVGPEDCIICGGFQGVKLEFHVDTYIRAVRDKGFIPKSRDNQNFHKDSK